MLTHQKLLELLHYDPDTGVFTWNKSIGGNFKGSTAGCDSRGYLVIRILGTLYLAHRLAWFYVYEKWPELELDHIDRNKANNTIKNLRQVLHADNSANIGVRKNSSSKITGVYFNKEKQKWHARLERNKKVHRLGYFDDFFDACCARKSAEQKHLSHMLFNDNKKS